MAKEPVRVAVTGAAGNIGYALVFRIASGAMLGPDQPVILQMLEITPALDALKGVAMELDDCAFCGPSTGISISCRITGWSLPSISPEAMRKRRA